MTASKFCLVLAALTAAAFAQAQGPPDLSKVEIKTTKLASNFYTLDGQGGTIGVLTGQQGILMIDSQYAQLTSKIVAAVRALSNAPIRFLINTTHDHTRGNENLGKIGVVIVARDELRGRLTLGDPGDDGQASAPMPELGLPIITYTGTMTFHMNGEDVRVFAMPRAHTDGDSMVQLLKADVIMTDDWFRSIQYPTIDRARGGSLRGLEEALSRAISMCGPNTKVVPAHGPVVGRSALMEHRDMIVSLRTKVAEMVRQGKTINEVIAAEPTAEWDAKVPEAGNTGERFVRQVYAELKSNWAALDGTSRDP